MNNIATTAKPATPRGRKAREAHAAPGLPPAPCMAITFLTLAITVTCAAPPPARAGGFLLFPKHSNMITAETLPYTQTLHSGVENDTFYMRGRFGVDFPVIGYNFGADGGSNGISSNNVVNNNTNNNNNVNNTVGKTVNFGITAAAHINMRPTSGMRFPVDNFYAVLALYFSGTYGARLSWRFYPVYHVSAHLADGYRGGDVIKSDVNAVSSEMVRAEAYYRLFDGRLELGAGAGRYYHVCAQKELVYRADISMLAMPVALAFGNNGAALRPYALIRAENAYQGKNNPGVDVAAGIIALKDRKGLGLNLRYFNRLHSSYYFEEYETGYGFELMFML